MSETNEPTSYNFDDLTPIEIPVQYKGTKYILKEADEKATEEFQNAQAKCVLFSKGEMSGSQGPVASTQSLLVSRCLFNVESGENIKIETIRSWPRRVVKPLFERAKKISEIDDEEETIKSLEKEAKEIQEKLKALREDPLEEESNDTEGGSD